MGSELTLQLCPLYVSAAAIVDHEHTKAYHHHSCCHLQMTEKTNQTKSRKTNSIPCRKTKDGKRSGTDSGVIPKILAGINCSARN